MKDSSFGVDNPQKIMGLARSFMQSRILLTAYELGVFSILEPNGASAAQAAEQLGANERGMDRLLSALAALGMIDKEKDRFINTPASAKFLVRESPDYLAGLMHSVHLYESWGTLTQAVQKGGSILKGGSSTWDENKKEAFISAMHWRAKRQAPEVAAVLDLKGVKKVLDVGGGSGIFSMAMVRKENGLSATVFDLSDIVPITARYIEQEGFSGRIDTVPGNYETDPLPAGYDLVYLSAIIHSNSPEKNEELVRKCAESCTKGGRVVVQDFIMEENRIEPVMGAQFALNMLVNTEKGDTFTESEIISWMEKAELDGIKRVNTSFGADMIIGVKA